MHPPATAFTAPGEGVSVPADGNYALHYFAQDCAGTEELQFTKSGGSWSTSFYTFPINVDTVNPVVDWADVVSGTHKQWLLGWSEGHRNLQLHGRPVRYCAGAAPRFT